MSEKTAKPLTKESIKIGRMQIVNNEHPEWGTFGVVEHYSSDSYVIRGDRGDRMLDASEFRFWSIV